MSIYRPPNGNLEAFLDEIEIILASHDIDLIVGDININVADINKCKQYIDMLNQHALKITNSAVTRSASNTIIDHVINKASETEILTLTSTATSLSDHNLLLTFMNFKCKRYGWKEKILKNIHYGKIKRNISNIDLSTCLNGGDVNTKCVNFTNVIQNTVFTNTKLIKIRVRKRDYIPKWADETYAKYIKTISNLQNKINKLRATNKPVNILSHQLQLLNNDFSLYCSRKARFFYSNLVLSQRNFSWKVINEVCGKGKEDSNLIIEKDDELIVHPKKVAEILNSKFGEIVGIKETHLTTFLGHPSSNSAYFDATTPNEVSNILQNLENNKSAGYDGISVKTWKTISEWTVNPISNLVNDMIASGEYPDILKIAKVIPVHKGKSKLTADNYRPISLLPILNKVFEKIIFNRMIGYLEKYKIQDNLQYGFTKGKGTADAVCKLASDVSSGLGTGCYAILVFFDLSKAFDSINHELLLFKLSKIGFRGITHKLITSYLDRRKQFVCVDGESSESTNINQGVPQGSTLGPLLFILMLYDFKYLRLNSKSYRFADDLALCYSGKILDVINGFELLVNDLKMVTEYFKLNGLDVNFSKTYYMPIGNIIFPNEINFDGHIVIKVDTAKYLGVVFDTHFSFQTHADKLMSKLNQIYNAILILRHQLNSTLLMQFFNAYFMSTIYYCSFLILRMTNNDLIRLQSVQNKCIKAIFRLNIRYPTNEVYKNYATRTLPVIGVAVYSTLCLIKKSISRNDDSLPNFNVINSGRRANDVKIDTAANNIQKLDIKHIGAKLYNRVPTEIRILKDENIFKSKLKSYLMSKIDKLLDRRIKIEDKLK